jgi:hypothetical protein
VSRLESEESMGSMGGILKTTTTTTTTRLESLYEALADDEKSASDPMLGLGQGGGSQENEGKVKKMKSMSSGSAGYV